MNTPTIRPDVRQFLDLLRAYPRPAMTTDTIAAMREMAPQGMAMLEPPIGELALMRDGVLPGPGGDIAYRVFDARAEREAGPAVVFYHGGGFVIGCIDTHASMCAEIARQLDLPVISVGYRLAPEHPWPAAPDDAEAAARWIASNGAAFGRAATSLVLCGDSAGGNLAIVTALALRDRPAAVPAVAVIALYPVTDSDRRGASQDRYGEGFGLDHTDTEFFKAAYQAPPGHWRASPVRAELAGLPAMLIATAELDPLRDQGREFAAKAVLAGVPTIYREAAGTIHGFLGYRRAIPSSQADLVALLALARQMMAHG